MALATTAAAVSGVAHADRAVLDPHPAVQGTAVTSADVAEGSRPEDARDFRREEWSKLSTTPLARGPRLLRFVAPGAARAVELPVCSGRGRVWIDGNEVAAPAGPLVVPLVARGEGGHAILVAVSVSEYERRIACGSAPRVGAPSLATDGLLVIDVASTHPAQGGGHAVVFLPPGHDAARPGPVLVGTHPWNASMWTYAAYKELLDEAAAKDVVLLMPSGLGNSLYTAAAEEEVLAAVDALSARIAVDPRRVSIWGASMGGAGATTIGFHHPDRFATVTSLFGDSRYDLATYVRAILRDEAGAHLVNALDVVDNARNLAVWLIHGTEDKVSPIAQSEMLATALRSRGFAVRFDRVPHAGHEGALVARNAAAIVDLASAARAPDTVPRVTYRSVRAVDTSAYGLRIERSSARGDAFVDVERSPDGVRVRRADGVLRIRLARGALGIDPRAAPPIARDPGVSAAASWDAVPVDPRGTEGER